MIQKRNNNLKIYFATSACSKEIYAKVFEMRNQKLLDPAQKFFEQIMSGIAKKDDVEVFSISALPVSASTVEKKIFKGFKEKSNQINFIYPSFINGKLLRYITIFLSSFFVAIKLFLFEKNKKEVAVLCDPLYVQIAKAVRFAAKICGIKSVAVVTDVPYFTTDMKKLNFSKIKHFLQKKYEAFCMKEMLAYDGYINLTKYMNPIVNPQNKPSIVIEGSVDIDVLNSLPLSNQKGNVIMYAGGVYEKYGLGLLVNGFVNANLDNVELHIYGEGSFVEQIQKISLTHPNVKYKGVALNTDLPLLESHATLLVNPRFTDEEYTKFSFPSKTLEYMTSGTPVLSTRLSGIPDDYEPYVYWLDEESEEGMACKLQELFKQSEYDFIEFGKKAKKFVAMEKSNVSQGKRIVEFGKKLVMK